MIIKINLSLKNGKANQANMIHKKIQKINKNKKLINQIKYKFRNNNRNKYLKYLIYNLHKN